MYQNIFLINEKMHRIIKSTVTAVYDQRANIANWRVRKIPETRHKTPVLDVKRCLWAINGGLYWRQRAFTTFDLRLGRAILVTVRCDSTRTQSQICTPYAIPLSLSSDTRNGRIRQPYYSIQTTILKTMFFLKRLKTNYVEHFWTQIYKDLACYYKVSRL